MNTKWGFMFLFIVFASLDLSCQIAPNCYWITFTDKNNSPYSLEKPEEFLSERSINRRSKQNIALSEDDLPVSLTYLDSLESLGLTIHNYSKWFNGAAIISTDTALLDTLHKLDFIANEFKTSVPKLHANVDINKYIPPLKSATAYGESANQIEMLHGDVLHDLNFDGSGMLIAVQDAGFANAIDLESLEHLWENNQIIAWRDFVADGDNIFDAHYHGTMVFSIIAGILADQMYGTATGADFVLVRTEDSNSEYLIEEYNWLAGAEYCDSLGVDIINSSLGYSEFTDASMNHSYEDLDGLTTPISSAASIAARKGMLVVTSAGNSGNDPWQYITAPADADSVLAIGAVNQTEVIAAFSGKGPTSDGRIKPDVSAQGVSTVGQIYNGSTSTCNGTSCSSPVIAGMAACLWQSTPEANAQEIRNAIIAASDRYTWPDTLYGFGIPDFSLAKQLLDSIVSIPENLSNLVLLPNPVNDYAQLTSTLSWLEESVSGEIRVMDVGGRILIQNSKVFNPGKTIHVLTELQSLKIGYYLLRIAISGRYYYIPFIKK